MILPSSHLLPSLASTLMVRIRSPDFPKGWSCPNPLIRIFCPCFEFGGILTIIVEVLEVTPLPSQPAQERVEPKEVPSHFAHVLSLLWSNSNLHPSSALEKSMSIPEVMSEPRCVSLCSSLFLACLLFCWPPNICENISGISKPENLEFEDLGPLLKNSSILLDSSYFLLASSVPILSYEDWMDLNLSSAALSPGFLSG